MAIGGLFNGSWSFMQKLSFVSLGVMLLFSPMTLKAQYLEPYISYGSGTEVGEVQFATSGVASQTEVDNQWSGFFLGSRLNLKANEKINYGLDLSLSQLSMAVNDDEVSVSGHHVGLFAGYDFSSRLKASANYIFLSKLSSTDTEISGKGFKLGVSYLITNPDVHFNLEYFLLSNDEAKFDALTIESYKTSFKGIAFSVSIPIHFTKSESQTD